MSDGTYNRPLRQLDPRGQDSRQDQRSEPRGWDFRTQDPRQDARAPQHADPKWRAEHEPEQRECSDNVLIVRRALTCARLERDAPPFSILERDEEDLSIGRCEAPAANP